MPITDVVILALVQGITEFLPVSSSGHLVAARIFLGISDAEGTAFDAFLHLGTLLAVLMYYWRVWWGMMRGVFISDSEGKDKRQLATKLIISTIPAAVMGFALQELVDQYFRSGRTLPYELLFTAGLLFVGDRLLNTSNGLKKRAGYADALIIGLAQVLALLPGVSRSGMTIATARWRGLTREKATEFSFLMSAPIIAGAGVSQILGLVGTDSFSLFQLSIGFTVSFLAGLLSIYGLMKVVTKISFLPFSIYLVILAGILLYVQ